MRPARVLAVLAAAAALASGGAARADGARPANPRSLVPGRYLLVLAPTSAHGRPVHVKRPVFLPVVVRTKGDALVVGGRYAPQMMGAIRNGAVSAHTIKGQSLTMTGATFNGYAASGRFHAGGAGAAGLDGEFALVTYSPAGVWLVGGARNLGQSRTGIGSSMSAGARGQNLGQQSPSGMGKGLGQQSGGFGQQPFGGAGSFGLGANGSGWGYHGPGLGSYFGGSTHGPGGYGSGINLPAGASGANASGKSPKGGKSDGGFSLGDWIDGLDWGSGSSGGQSGGGSTSGGSKGSGDSGGFLDGLVDEASHLGDDLAEDAKDICQSVGGCGDDGKTGSGDGNKGGKDGGGFEAGDWDPAGGDDGSSGKIHRGNGQDSGGKGGGRTDQGSSSGGGRNAQGKAFKKPGVGGDGPGDWFQVGASDVINTSHLFNGASDPTRR